MHPFRPTIHARISSCSATLRAPCSSMNRYSSRLEVSPSLFCVEGPHPSTQLYCYSQSYTDAHSRYSDQFGFHSHWSLVLVYVRSKIDKRVLDWKWKWSCTYEQLSAACRKNLNVNYWEIWNVKTKLFRIANMTVAESSLKIFHVNLYLLRFKWHMLAQWRGKYEYCRRMIWEGKNSFFSQVYLLRVCTCTCVCIGNSFYFGFRPQATISITVIFPQLRWKKGWHIYFSQIH